MSSLSILPRWQTRQKLLDFAPEWLGVGLVCLADILLAPGAALTVAITWHCANLIVIPLVLIAATLRKFGALRAGMILEFLALVLAAGPALAVSTYIAAIKAGPLIDGTFLALDRAMGFHWLSWFHFITAHTQLAAGLKFLYASGPMQVLYFSVLMGVMGNVRRLREIFWLIFLALALASLGSWLAPAVGPFPAFGLQSFGQFLPEMARLRSGHAIHIALENMQGVVTFPSFHTALALGMAYAFRGTGVIGWTVAAADLAMLLGVPVFGGHYLVDMIAGAGVFALSLAIVRIVPRLHAARAHEIAGFEPARATS